jgi:hypothetical protein
MLLTFEELASAQKTYNFLKYYLRLALLIICIILNDNKKMRSHKI